jgi:hypothetical protein
MLVDEGSVTVQGVGFPGVCILKCRIGIDTLQQYQDGTLSTEEKSKFENHLAGCRECQENLMLIGMISKHMQQGETVSDNHAAARIMSRLDKQRYGRDRLSSRLRILANKLLPLGRKAVSGLTAAACVFVVAAGIIAFDRAFGDILAGRGLLRSTSKQPGAEHSDPASEQQPDSGQPDPSLEQQPGSELPGPADTQNSAVIERIFEDAGYKESCRISISVADASGRPVNLSNASFYIRCGESVMWGRGAGWEGSNKMGKLHGNLGTEYFRIYSYNIGEDIVFWLSGDIDGNSAFYIFDTIKTADFEGGDVVNISYDLEDLHSVSLDLDFTDRIGGQYEIDIYDFRFGELETLNGGSMITFRGKGPKSLMIPTGSYGFVFKYTDVGMCSLVSKKFDITGNGAISVAKDDVDFKEYVFREPAAWRDYKYYFVWTGIRDLNGKFYLKGMLDEDGSVSVLFDRNTPHYPPGINYSKNPETEYDSSIFTYIQDPGIQDISGEAFVPSRIDALDLEGKWTIHQFFSDITGNECRFIGLPRNKDMLMEIYDPSGEVLLHKFTYNKYWDYFEPELERGEYLVRVYPLVRELGIEGNAEYILTISDKPIFVLRKP